MDLSRAEESMELSQDIETEESMDPFAQLPIEIIHTILSFLTPKQSVQTSILSKTFLQAWSTRPDLNFVDKAFSKLLRISLSDPDNIQEASKVIETFANYVHQTLTRYQQHNIPIRRLCIESRVRDEKIANILEQCILKAKEINVKEVGLQMRRIPPSNLLQTIFTLKQLVSLTLQECKLVKKDVQDFEIINCSSLRKLELYRLTIDEGVLQNLIRSCPLIEVMKLFYCQGPETIQVHNLPHLKRLRVDTVKNQAVDVKAASLEHMIYYGRGQDRNDTCLLTESTKNLKTLSLGYSTISDEDFHNLTANCPVLEKVMLDNCDKIQKINVSSHSLRLLSLINCSGLKEVMIDAPNLDLFDYAGDLVHLSLSFASRGSGKRNSKVLLCLDHLEEASSFLRLREFLKMPKSSDKITLYITSTEVRVDTNIMGDLRGQYNIPEFEEVCIIVTSPSSTYSTLMEGLLWTFSPKILSVKSVLEYDQEFIKYICEELLVERDTRNTSCSSSEYWRNYFKQAWFEDRDNEWRPLHTWKSCADALHNLRNQYILKLARA